MASFWLSRVLENTGQQAAIKQLLCNPVTRPESIPDILVIVTKCSCTEYSYILLGGGGGALKIVTVSVLQGYKGYVILLSTLYCSAAFPVSVLITC